MANVKVKHNEEAFYKKWWFWVIAAILFIGIIAAGGKSGKESVNEEEYEQTVSTSQTEVKDYTGKDAKKAYEELKAAGYNIKFIFDRPNQGGFTDESFQDFVLNDSFASASYTEMPFVVKSQQNMDKNVYLYIDYGSVVESENNQAAMEAKLEEKLSIVSAMTACEQYGKRNYRNFKMHSIVGKISEYASDENTWFLKYSVDYDGYKNRAMECYVTGTTAAPEVSKFLVY